MPEACPSQTFVIPLTWGINGENFRKVASPPLLPPPAGAFCSKTKSTIYVLFKITPKINKSSLEFHIEGLPLKEKKNLARALGMHINANCI